MRRRPFAAAFRSGADSRELNPAVEYVRAEDEGEAEAAGPPPPRAGGVLATWHGTVRVPCFSMEFAARREGLLAVVDEEGFATILDTAAPLPQSLKEAQETGFRPPRQFVAHNNAVFDVCWCHDDERLVTASGDTTLVVWDVETGAARLQLKGHAASVKAVCPRPGDAAVLASGGRDGERGMPVPAPVLLRAPEAGD